MDHMIVGREEWCSFPSIGIHAIKARVDSGAKTSSIHAENIQEIKTDGILKVPFDVCPLQDSKRVKVRCEAEVVDKRKLIGSRVYL